MKLLLAIALLFATAAHADPTDDYFFAEVGTYKKYGGAQSYIGEYPARISVGYAVQWRHFYTKVEAVHVSNVDKGAPFNESDETYFGAVGVVFGWRTR